MTRYLVEEVVTSGYSIDRGVYDNPKDAQYRAMVSVKNKFDAETALKEHVIHCEELYRRALKCPL